MTTRRFVYWLLVLMPAVLLASAALESRFGPATFRLPEHTPAQAARVRSYAPLVSLTNVILRENADPTVLVSTAKLWIEGRRAGRLQDVYPISSADTILRGVKGEIFMTRRQLVNQLISAGTRLETSDPDLAARLSVTAIALSEVFKYADLQGLALSAADQTRALGILDRVLDGLTHAQQVEAARVLARVHDGQRALGPFLALSYRNHRNSLHREDGTLALASGLHEAPRRKAVLNQIEALMRQIHDDEAATFVSRLYAGIVADNEQRGLLERTLTRLPETPTGMLASR